MNISKLESIAMSLVSDNKGILAADESTSTIKKRFDALGIESTEETRRAYREMLFSTTGIGEYVSGVIMFDETIRQASDGGVLFPRLLESEGVVPGIKVDMGVKLMEESNKELLTQGLEGMKERLEEYYKLGARFAKWRAVITIGDNMPTELCIKKNAEALAKYARMCQEADIVPIVEPEALMDGVHSMSQCFDATFAAQKEVFNALRKERVVLSGILLKPNMILPGDKSNEYATAEEIADATVRCLRANVPPEVPGIVFLSGGQSEEEATLNLNVINQRKGDAPWPLSFSYGRALQASAMKIWGGKAENVPTAQKMFIKRARLNSIASAGEYTKEMEE